jgi:hypothetical protein
MSFVFHNTFAVFRVLYAALCKQNKPFSLLGVVQECQNTILTVLKNQDS